MQLEAHFAIFINKQQKTIWECVGVGMGVGVGVCVCVCVGLNCAQGWFL